MEFDHEKITDIQLVFGFIVVLYIIHLFNRCTPIIASRVLIAENARTQNKYIISKTVKLSNNVIDNDFYTQIKSGSKLEYDFYDIILENNKNGFVIIKIKGKQIKKVSDKSFFSIRKGIIYVDGNPINQPKYFNFNKLITISGGLIIVLFYFFII